MNNKIKDIIKKTVSILLLAVFAVSAIPSNLTAYAVNKDLIDLFLFVCSN